MKKNSMIITIILVIAVGAGAFFAGMKYQQSKRQASFSGQFGQGQGQRTGMGANRMGFRPVNGDIISSDDKSITVKLQDGSSRIVLLSDKTVYFKSSTGLKSDLKIGDKVAAFGTENSDGSVTAQNIQLNPIFRSDRAQTSN